MKRTSGLAVALAGALVLSACTGPAGPGSDSLNQPAVANSLLDAADVAEAQNDHATAAGYYRNVLSRDPKNARAAVGLMQSLRALGALDQARDVAAVALAANPDNPAVLAEVGKVRLARGDLQDAVTLLERAAALEPKDWKVRSALGVAYDRLGDPTKAEDSYKAALRIAPDNAAVLNNYALSRAMAHDLPGARALLQRAVAGVGSDVRVRQNLALIYALSGDMTQAEALTVHDLPPDLARKTLAYYRELAAHAQSPQLQQSQQP